VQHIFGAETLFLESLAQELRK